MKLSAEYLSDFIIMTVVIISVYTDVKYRKIFNKIVFPALIVGLLLHTVLLGFDGLLFGLKGLSLGFALLLVPFLLGGFGAGDVKLLSAIGALKGTSFVFKVFLAAGLSGGVLAVLVLVKERRLLSTLKRICLALYIFVGSVFRVNTLKSLDKAEYSESLPFGVAIGIGTIIAYLVG